jgi:phosphate:Na+ symporter
MVSVAWFVNLAGAIALLLWSSELVSSSVQRALGSRLQLLLARSLKTRLHALIGGMLATAAIQSSTAVAFITTSLNAAGLIDLCTAIAIMLGANVGTTFIVQLLAIDLSILPPMLITAGLIMHRGSKRMARREGAQAMIGLGLTLLALKLLTTTLIPLEGSHLFHEVLPEITREPLLAALLAVGLSWAAHSSVATMLLIMSLAQADAITVQVALAMVLGANVGSALNPVFGTLDQPRWKVRLPMMNLFNRLIGCAVAFPLLPWITPFLTRHSSGAGQAVAEFHLLFNAVLAVAFFGVLPLLAKAITSIFPDETGLHGQGNPKYLRDGMDLSVSTIISDSVRETLYMSDVVDNMLAASQESYLTDDRDQIERVIELEKVVDRIFDQIQFYLARADTSTLGEADIDRLESVLSLVINLEQIGDVIERNLMRGSLSRMEAREPITLELRNEIAEMHQLLRSHLGWAVSVFLSGDVAVAERLVLSKEEFRKRERSLAARHRQWIRSGAVSEVAMSAIMLDITRDLKRIDGHIASTVHELLERHGMLADSRLRSEVPSLLRTDSP